MRRPSVRMTLARMMVLMAVVALVLWWITDQPRRRGKAISATRRAGGVVQLDDDYRPPVQVPTPRPSRSTGRTRTAMIKLPPPSRSGGWLEKHLGAGFAHNVSVINLDGQ